MATNGRGHVPTVAQRLGVAPLRVIRPTSSTGGLHRRPRWIASTRALLRLSDIRRCALTPSTACSNDSSRFASEPRGRLRQLVDAYE